MLRASVAAERAGVPTASLVAEGFVRQALTTLNGLGMPNLPLAVLPGHLGVQARAEMRQHVVSDTLPMVVSALTQQPEAASSVAEPSPREIVFKGSFSQVNDYFCEREWSDGLPIVPPTLDRVAAFLRFTDRQPDEVLGVVLPDNRAATIWTVAVNGVLAGCRPEYMPVLVAIAEAMCDPLYGVESSGNTPGSDTVIVLNGPITKELGFNFEQGVLRDGFRANSTVGRFFRLCLRNICGFLPHKTDKGTFGNTFRVVMPENDDVLHELGWDPISVEMGIAPGRSAVTLARYSGGDVLISVSGEQPEIFMPYIADAAVRMTSWQLTFTIGAMSRGMLRPLLLITPILAKTFARAGWTKQRIREYLFEHARIPAWKYENYIKNWTETTTFDLRQLVRLGDAPRMFYEAADPNRMLPLVTHPDDFIIAVTGDPLRTNAYMFTHNGTLGYPTCKAIELPKAWPDLLAESGSRSP